MPIEPDGRTVTHMHVCGASRFSIFVGPFWEKPFGNRFWDNRAVATRAINAYFRLSRYGFPIGKETQIMSR